MRIAALLALSFIASTLAHSATAFAGEKRAQQLYLKGQAAYVEGRFAEAAARFEDAYALLPRPQLLWNIGQARRKLFYLGHDPADLHKAESAFRRYTETALSDEERRDAEVAHREMAQLVEAMADAPKPLPSPDKPPPAPTSPPERRATERGPEAAAPWRKPAFVFLGAGAGVAAVGLVLGLLSQSAARSVESAGSPDHMAPFAGVADLDQQGRALETGSYVLYGIGAAAVAAGLVLALIPPRRSVHAWIAPGPGGLLAGGAW